MERQLTIHQGLFFTSESVSPGEPLQDRRHEVALAPASIRAYGQIFSTNPIALRVRTEFRKLDLIVMGLFFEEPCVAPETGARQSGELRAIRATLVPLKLECQ